MSNDITEFPGRIIAFAQVRDDELADHTTLIEVTDSERDGTIEIAFNTNLPRKPRVYVRFRLQDLMRELMKQVTSE